MRSILDIIKVVVKAVRFPFLTATVLALVPRRVMITTQKMVEKEVITKEQADVFYQDYLRNGGRFGVNDMTVMVDLSRLAGYGVSILELSNFKKDFMTS